jgi:hypothetical protein
MKHFSKTHLPGKHKAQNFTLFLLNLSGLIRLLFAQLVKDPTTKNPPTFFSF